jgi:hypothetical protein
MRSWPVTGWSATELSATDASAEPLPVIKVNVWASLYVPWARNPMYWPPPHMAMGMLTARATGAAGYAEGLNDHKLSDSNIVPKWVRWRWRNSR